MDDAPVFRRMGGNVLGDCLMHPGQQVEAAVDVADRVDAHAVRTNGV
jgi:hypothetical protein